MFISEFENTKEGLLTKYLAGKSPEEELTPLLRDYRVHYTILLTAEYTRYKVKIIV